jgi:hypothetical protein
MNDPAINKNQTNKLTLFGLNAFLVVGIASIILKMCNMVPWGWFWALVPFWGPPTLFFIVLLFVFAAVEVVQLVMWLWRSIK